MGDIRFGIDLGGTKIEIVAIGPGSKELVRERVPTPRGDYDRTIRAIVDLVRATESKLGGEAPLGIGIPGTISPATGLVKNANNTDLNGHPLDRDVTAALGREVRVMNDANCFALSEAVDGSGAGAAVVFGVILGTGVGGGIVVDGRLLGGANAIGGEWGHNPLPCAEDGLERPGQACYCSKPGCVETFLSGPGLALDHKIATGQDLGAAAIVKAAEGGDAAAEATLKRYEDRLARSLAVVINIVDPDVVVLGGGLSQVQRLYRNVPALLPRYVFSDRVDTVMKPPAHGDSSGVRGAAWLWPPDRPA